MNWMFILIIFIAALVCCAMGFKRFVWFMSVGYGFAVAGIAVASIAYGLVNANMTLCVGVGNIVMVIYGLRLGVFLLSRELKNKAYKKILDAKTGKEPPFFVKAVMWLCMGALYVCQTAGLHFRLTNGTPDDIVLAVGIVIMGIGTVIEALADVQKNAQKTKNPNMVATEGLFKMVRCPNYFGEILFWTGVFVAGVTAYTGVAQWCIAAFGYVCIFYVMWDGAKRMEKGHIARYGEKPEYQAYASKTPILIPLVPLYHIYNSAKDKKNKQAEKKEE